MARPAVFLNGMHHARELSTLSMDVYLMLKILFLYVHNDYKTIFLLEETAIFFVPIINLDGYIRIGSNWDKNSDLAEVRKNSHRYSS